MRQNGKKSVKVKKITKVKAPRKKREKKSFSDPDPFHPWEFPLMSEWEDKFPEAAELMYTLNKAEIAKLPNEYDPETGREMFSFADTLKIWNDEVEAQILDGDNSDARFGFANDELRRKYI